MLRAFAAALAFGLALSGTARAMDCTSAGVPAQEMIRMVNAERAARGEGPVRFSAELSRVAQGHACDMARKGYFGHRSPDGGSLKSRVTRAGYRPCAAAENIARGLTTPGDTSRAWMKSSGHRKNILWRQVQEAGVGRAGSGDQMNWVLVLARPCN